MDPYFYFTRLSSCRTTQSTDTLSKTVEDLTTALPLYTTRAKNGWLRPWK